MSRLKIRRDPLDKLFSDYVRAKAGWKCERCGSMPDRRGLHCHHFERRRKLSTRFDEMGCSSLCLGCHQYLGENREEDKAFLINKIGQREFDMLEGRARITQKIDRDAIKLYLEEQIRKLK